MHPTDNPPARHIRPIFDEYYADPKSSPEPTPDETVS
jgi:hypothetical protein